MRQFNYKCTITKNGTKTYYKRVNKKWKKISNSIGEKAEKGKTKYRANCSVKSESKCDADIDCYWYEGNCGETVQTHNRRIKRQQMITYFEKKIKECSNDKDNINSLANTSKKKYYEYLKKQTQKLPDEHIDDNYTKLQIWVENQGEGDELDVAIQRDTLFQNKK